MNAPESTLFNAVPVVSELNRVAGFDPLKFLKKTARGHELELRYKKLWFRLKYPAGRTRLTPLRITDQLAIIEAKVFFDKDDADPASSYIATMTQENAPAGLYIQAAEPAVETELPFVYDEPNVASYTKDMDVDTICTLMTEAEAEEIIVPIGTCSGQTLKQVAERRPASLKWYVKGYSGDDNILRAGAKLMLDKLQRLANAS